MKTLLRRPGFGGFLFAQAQVAFNDNGTKLILTGLVQSLLPASEASRLEMLGIAAILLGSLAGGFFIDTVAAFVGSPWSAAVLVLGVLASTSRAKSGTFPGEKSSGILPQPFFCPPRCSPR
jgi:hypothetical protein